jgi:hypothetical protein
MEDLIKELALANLVILNKTQKSVMIWKGGTGVNTYTYEGVEIDHFNMGTLNPDVDYAEAIMMAHTNPGVNEYEVLKPSNL